MAVTKKTTVIETDGVIIPEERAVGAGEAEETVAAKPMRDRQVFTTVAIVSGLLLFMLGMGLGFICGRTLSNDRRPMMDGYRYNSGSLRNRDDSYYGGGMMYQRGTSQTPQNQTTPNTNPTTPQTQTN